MVMHLYLMGHGMLSDIKGGIKMKIKDTSHIGMIVGAISLIIVLIK